MIIPPDTMPYGRQQPLGCCWCNKRPLAGGMPYKGFVPRTFFPPTLTHKISGSSARNIDSSQGTAVLCRVSGAKPGVLCGAVRELQQCMTLLMTTNGNNVMEVSLLRPVEEESGAYPTLEEVTALLARGDGPSGAPGPAPQHAKNPRFIELA